jgi:hypothetical protein
MGEAKKGHSEVFGMTFLFEVAPNRLISEAEKF